MASIQKLSRDRGRDVETLTYDEVLLDIVTAREEAADARQMDQARMLSEQEQEREKRERKEVQKQERERQLREASVGQWKSDPTMFKDSWLLGHDSLYANVDNCISAAARHCPDLKPKVIELLQLEKQARKWYDKLPRAYFTFEAANRLSASVGTAGSSETTMKLLRQVETEIANLSRAMYSLSEQSGGTPRVFLEAHDKWDRRPDADVDVVGFVDAATSGRNLPVAPTAAI